MRSSVGRHRGACMHRLALAGACGTAAVLSTAQHSTAQHSTAQHNYKPQRSTAQRSTPAAAPHLKCTVVCTMLFSWGLVRKA